MIKINLKKTAADIVAMFRDPNALVAEIHEAFDTAGDKAIEAVNAILNDDNPNYTKGNRLRKLGFSNALSVKDADTKTIERVKAFKLKTSYAYFKEHYPNHKYIDEATVDKILHKYGLICGDVTKYIGDVPEKNLLEIEAFTLRKEDCITCVSNWYRQEMGWANNRIRLTNESDEDAFWGYLDDELQTIVNTPKDQKITYKKPLLKICAPRHLFNLEGYRVINNRLVRIEDPIVLQPVDKGYLVVTKWGLEGDDDMLK